MKVTIDNFSRINACEYIVLYLNIKNNKIVENKNINNCSKTMSNMDIDNTTMFNVSDFIDQYNFENKQHKTLTDYLNQNYDLVCHAIMQKYSGINIKDFDENSEYNYPNILQTVSINGNYVDQLFCKELFISLLSWLDPILAYDIHHFIIQVKYQTVTNSKKINNNDSQITDEKIKPSIDIKTIKKSIVRPKFYSHSSNQIVSNWSYVVSKTTNNTSYIHIEGKFIETKKLNKNIIKNPNNIIIHGIDFSNPYGYIVHKKLRKIFTKHAYPGLIETPSSFSIPENLSVKLNDKSVTKKIVNVLLYAARISLIPEKRQVKRRIIDSYDELTISTNTNITDYVSYMLKEMFEYNDPVYDDIPFYEFDSDISSNSNESESYDYETEYNSSSSDGFKPSDDDYESDYTQ